MRKESEIEKCIHEGLGWTGAKVQEIKQVKGGYLSDAYVVTVLNEEQLVKLFIKEQNANKWGTERPVDSLATYTASHLAAQESDLAPRVLGSFIQPGDNNETSISIEKIVDGKLFQIQEYVEGDNLLELLSPNISPILLNRADEIGERVARIFAEIHAHKYPIEQNVQFDIYSRTLRDVIAHPELTLNVFQNFLKDSLVFAGEFRYDYLKEMFKVADHFAQYKARNALIHGDAWHANFLLNKNELHLIDYSRMVYGEPGIDVGQFYMASLWFAIQQHDDFHIRTANAFLEKYVELTSDDFIHESMTAYIGFTGAVCAVETFYPTVSPDDRANFVSYVYSCLQNKIVRKVTTWKEIK